SELSSSDDDRYVPPRTTTVASTALLLSSPSPHLNPTSDTSLTRTATTNTRRVHLNDSHSEHSVSSSSQH
ncbi:hypothetical protein M8J76_007205, partial [Diaphorina citri]